MDPNRVGIGSPLDEATSRHPMGPVVAEADIAAYEEDGVVCIRRLLDEGWVARLREAIARVERNPGPFRERYSPEDPGIFMSEKFLWTFDPDFRACAFDSPQAEAAGLLMRATKVNVFYDHLMVKNPGAVSPTPWHQDLNYWPAEGRQICSVWVAFDPVDRDNGGMEFVAGSHRSGRRFQPFDFRLPEAVETDEFEKLPDIDQRRGDYRILSWDLEPGDGLVFSALTLHGAAGNRTLRRRRALSTRYAGDDMRFIKRNKVIKLLFDPGLEPGDPLDCDLFPVVWRRPT
ncbi:MAG: phytanoyl-CoA dioxygenase family protein [Pseudomonadota bacterium]